MAKIHRSKTDTWLVVLILLALGSAFFGIVSAVVAGGPGFWWAVLLPGVVGIGLPIWVLLTTRYILEDEILIVRSGPFRWKIPIHEIADISPTSNPLASPALSLDRLRIDYGQGRSLMISPGDKDRFIADLMAARGSFA